MDDTSERQTGEMNGLKVYMMGTVVMEYRGELLPFSYNSSSKVMQLMLILLHAGQKGIGREEVLEMLYGEDDSANPSRNLRAIVFRLRKLLETSGLPKHEYIRTDGGIYRWDNGDLPIYVDSGEFEELGRRGVEQKDEGLLKQACHLYRGEFLAQLATERWVSLASIRYQQLYFNCLRTLYSLMKENREYEELLEFCSRACQLYPYEECQIMKIDCLIAMKRYKEAMRVYDQAVTQYFEEQGLPPSEKMLSRFRIMSGQIRYTSSTMEDIHATLKEHDSINGPYYCGYPGFIDCYRLLRRMAERLNFSSVVLCCTLLDVKGRPLGADGELLKISSRVLREAIGLSLRKGDLFTCFSPNQYLIMLNGTSQEYCLRIFERVDQTVHQWDGGRKVKMNYQIIPDEFL